MLRLYRRRGQAAAAQNATAKSGSVTRRNPRGKIGRNLSFVPNAAFPVFTRAHELPLHLTSQTLVVYLDHSAHRTH